MGGMGNAPATPRAPRACWWLSRMKRRVAKTKWHFSREPELLKPISRRSGKAGSIPVLRRLPAGARRGDCLGARPHAQASTVALPSFKRRAKPERPPRWPCCEPPHTNTQPPGCTPAWSPKLRSSQSNAWSRVPLHVKRALPRGRDRPRAKSPTKAHLRMPQGAAGSPCCKGGGQGRRCVRRPPKSAWRMRSFWTSEGAA